jgi:hypothetical protein
MDARSVVMLALAVFALVACGGGDGVTAELDDAGPTTLDGAPDAGPEMFVDDSLCDPLIARTCGDADACGAEAACVAARLFATHEPDRCAAAYDDELHYPPCEADACTQLVEKVCGALDENPPCVDEPGCSIARELRADALDDALSASARNEALGGCAVGLEDELVFPACGL